MPKKGKKRKKRKNPNNHQKSLDLKECGNKYFTQQVYETAMKKKTVKENYQ